MQAKAHNALLIDEGFDVFQYVKGAKDEEKATREDFTVKSYETWNDEKKQWEVRQNRDRLRAIFILARKKSDSVSSDEEKPPA
jgi:hypothetical protein